MADDKQVEIVIRAKNLTDAAFKQVQAAIRSVDSESQKVTAKGGADWSKWFKTIAGGAAVGNLLSDAFKTVGRELVNIPNQLIALGERGADVRDVRSAFEGLTTSVGQTSQAMLGQLRQAFGGTVNDFELMRSANEGLSKGVKFTAADMGVLGKAARVMADRVGGDAKQSFDQMIAGIANGRERTLRQLPLDFGNIERAVESYARSIDKETNELSEAEKQEALRQAVLQESQRILSESGEVENDFADQVKAGAVQVQNYTDRIGEMIAQHGSAIAGLGGMAQAAAALSPVLGATGLAGAAGSLAGIILSPVGLVAALGAAAVAFTLIKVDQIEAQAEAMRQASAILKRAVTDAKEAADIVKAHQAGLSGAQLQGSNATLDVAEAWRLGAEAAGKLGKEVSTLTIQGFGPGTTTTKSYAQVAKDLRAEMEKLPKATRDEIAAMRLLGKSDDEIRQKFGLTEAKLRILDQLKKDGVKAAKNYERAWKDLLTPLHDAAGGLENLRHIMPGVVDVDAIQRMTELERLTREQVPAAENWHERLMRVRGEVAALVPGLEAMNDKLADQQRIAKDMIAKATAALNAEIEKGLNFGNRLSQTIIGAITGGGNVGQSIGAFLGDEIGKSLGENLAKAIGGKLGGALGGLIGPLGAIGGQLIGGLFDKMFSTAGRDTVRQWVDSTFGSFDQLREKLKELPDGENIWINLTQRVGRGDAEQAKAAIDAVTAAFERQKTTISETGEAAKVAAQAEVDAQQKVIDEIKGRREALAREIADLTKRIDAEAQEEQIGIQEQRDRAERDRLLERQRIVDEELARAEAKQAENVQRLEDAIKALADALDRLTSKTWKVPIEFDYQNAPPSASSGDGEMPEHDTGAFIRQDHVARVHAGELIGPVDFMTRALTGALANVGGGRAGLGGGVVIVQFGTREVARTLVPDIADEIKRLRLV